MIKLIVVCLCADLGVIGTGFAARILPSRRQTGHSSACSMRRRYAQCEWCMRENFGPPSRQQVRPRKNLLSTNSRRHADLAGTSTTIVGSTMRYPPERRR
jgi:hypothetical protein